MLKIVMVDDTPMSLTMLEYLVRKLPGCQAHCFANPHEGLAWCAANQPDLLIVDFMMPSLDGTALVAQFRQMHREVPVLMVTANYDIALRHKALQTGVTDFLNKPLDNVEFIARAKIMLALRESQIRSEDRISWLDKEVRKATEKLVEQERTTIFCLSRAAEYRDPETGSHILRMAHYSQHIARMLNMSTQEQALLLEAAPMHDIGKVATPDAILLKPGRLTPEEFTIMKQHAEIGFRILSQMSSPLLDAAAQIAYTHHEKFDGSGYPRGLAGADIPLMGRIVAVADVFDALTSARPYKKAWTIEAAVALLKDGAGRHFDPDCVAAFLDKWDDVMAIRAQFADEENDMEAMRVAEVHL